MYLFIYLFIYFKKKIAHTFSLLLVLLLIEKINARCSCAAIAQLGERQTEDLNFQFDPGSRQPVHTST